MLGAASMTPGEEEDLKAAEKLMRTVCDGALDASFVSDYEGRIVAWNAAAENLFGCPAPDALGGDLHHVLTRMGCPDSFSDGPFPLYWIVQKQDGSRLPVVMSITPVYVQDQWYGLAIVHTSTKQTRGF
jgi:PAS domain-containing protein